ncbi:MAG: PIN domain-containing protein [Chlorobiaceae bacterium]|nr:PIN domain-containing protein [Chlorobiaceae bacterium]
MLLISDANILIDMEAGELLQKFFRLPMRIGIPDILYREEIEPGSPGLEALGLLLVEIEGYFVEYAFNLPLRYGNGPSHNDYLALALAKQEKCPLLTGDQALKKVAIAEKVDTKGTIWVLKSMVSHKVIDLKEALDSLDKMKQSGRRRPWDEAERLLKAIGKE